MRLYKDIKIELKSILNVNITKRIECDAAIKKYGGNITIESINSPYTQNEFTKMISNRYIDDILRYGDIDDKTIYINSLKRLESLVEVYRQNYKEIDRHNAKITMVYDANIPYEITYIIYGRLFIGNGSNFEDCFETRSGQKLDELLTFTNSIDGIKTLLRNEFDVNITYDLDDNVKLLPNDNEFSEAIYQNKDTILDAIEDDLNSKIYGNPYDE